MDAKLRPRARTEVGEAGSLIPRLLLRPVSLLLRKFSLASMAFLKSSSESEPYKCWLVADMGTGEVGDRCTTEPSRTVGLTARSSGVGRRDVLRSRPV